MTNPDGIEAQTIQPNIWAPPWYITAAFVGVIIFTLVTSPPLNPFIILGATFSGAVGGAVGGALGAVFSHLYNQRVAGGLKHSQLITGALVAVGFILVKLLEAGVLSGAMALAQNKELLGLAAIGTGVGALAGLLPQYGLLKRNPDFGALSYWLCAALGAIGGGVLAVPAALAAYFIGRSRVSR